MKRVFKAHLKKKFLVVDLKRQKSTRSQENYDIGVEFFQRQNFSKAKHYLSEACKLKHPKAFSLLGNFYLNPETGEYNTSIAKKYFEKGAEVGDLDSISNLGVLYESEGDLKQAEQYLKQAVEKGSESALCNLGLLKLRHGNMTEGMSLMEKAAQMNDPVAIFFMGESILYGSFGCDINYEKAQEYFETIQENVADARVMLAYMRLKGYSGGPLNVNQTQEDIDANVKSGIDLLRLESQNCPGLAKALLGIIYCEGVPTVIQGGRSRNHEFLANPSEGLLLLSSSAMEHGNEIALMTLAVYYGMGKFVQQDIARSYDIIGKLSTTYGNQSVKQILQDVEKLSERGTIILEAIMSKCFEGGVKTWDQTMEAVKPALVDMAMTQISDWDENRRKNTNVALGIEAGQSLLDKEFLEKMMFPPDQIKPPAESTGTPSTSSASNVDDNMQAYSSSGATDGNENPK